jgi:hypothetical protein
VCLDAAMFQLSEGNRIRHRSDSQEDKNWWSNFISVLEEDHNYHQACKLLRDNPEKINRTRLVTLFKKDLVRLADHYFTHFP